MRYIDWDKLEKNVKNIKASNENVKPLNQQPVTLEQRQEIQQQFDSPQSSAAPNNDTSVTTSILMNQDVDGSDAEERMIEVENVKGKIVKIDPNDYSVLIQAQGDCPEIRGKLSQLKHGVYLTIANQFGLEKAIKCLISDAKQKSIGKITLAEAKLALKSIKRTGKHLNKESIDRVIAQLSANDAESLIIWLHDTI